MSIIYATYQRDDYVVKAVKYTWPKEEGQAKEIFKLKTGHDFETTRSDELMMLHIPVSSGGCNSRSEEGCFQCETNGSFYLLEKGGPVDGYNVEHFDDSGLMAEQQKGA
jgi:hypothetical protein